jgi:hypothetical protein
MNRILQEEKVKERTFLQEDWICRGTQEQEQYHSFREEVFRKASPPSTLPELLCWRIHLKRACRVKCRGPCL